MDKKDSAVIKTLFLSLFLNLIISSLIASSQDVGTEESCTTQVLVAETIRNEVLLEKKCDTQRLNITALHDLSIILFSFAANYSDNATNANNTDDRWIKIEFRESTILKSVDKKSVVVNEWVIRPPNSTSEDGKNYYSRSGSLQIHITINGNWEDFNPKFYYEEIEFITDLKTSKATEGEVEHRNYRRNCVSIYQITPSKDVNVSSIHLELLDLSIDEEIGEYLLVGAGEMPFEGPPPLFISNQRQINKIKINDENAFVAFVSASTRPGHDGFRIIWRSNATKIDTKTIEEDIKNDDALQAVPICIKNKTAAYAELKLSNPFAEFREEIASISTEYAKNKSYGFEITSKQVHIFRVSAVLKDTLYVMLKIQGIKEGIAAFHWTELEKITKIYFRHYSEKVRNFKIEDCPSASPSKRNYALYIIIPVLCCLFLFIGTWKQNPISKYFSNHSKFHKPQSQLSPLDESLYATIDENTLPIVHITDDQGRRYTYKDTEDNSSSSTEQDSDKDFKRGDRLPNHIEESKSSRKSIKSSKTPEINLAYEGDEETTF